MRLPILLAVATLALVAGGCGGGSDEPEEPQGTPPRQWVGSVCSALDQWQTTLKDKARGLPAEVLQSPSPDAAKRRIEAFLDEVLADTDAMIRRVGQAGRPAVERGGQAAAAVQGRLKRVRAAFVETLRRVRKVPTDDPSAFQRELTDIGHDLLAQGRALGEILAQEDTRPLRDAIQATATCKAFSGGSGN